tara:strand:+ start:9317 stop:9904 length:588 start_codon:yes stop_codon:yes gene_type:complete
MKLLIHGRNLELTDALREYTQSKLEKAFHHYDEIVKEADVHLSVARNPRVPQQIAEVTVFVNGTVIRAQERSENLYSSIDLVASKLCRQLRKYKERHNKHHPNHGSKVPTTPRTDKTYNKTPIDNSLIEGKEAHLPEPGIRRKYFSMKPMNIDQARYQLDLIDHSFYFFRNEDNNELQVIYKRNHGGYGLIQAKE